MGLFDIIAKLDIVGILRFSVLGLAFLLALLSAALLLALISGKKTTKDLELYKLRSRTVVTFMIIQLSVCVIAGAFEISRNLVNPEVRMAVTISPASMPDYLSMPAVAKGSAPIVLVSGYGETDVRRMDSIRVMLEDLVEKARTQNAVLTEKIRELAAMRPADAAAARQGF
jgi:hypothetical protein